MRPAERLGRFVESIGTAVGILPATACSGRFATTTLRATIQAATRSNHRRDASNRILTMTDDARRRDSLGLPEHPPFVPLHAQARRSSRNQRRRQTGPNTERPRSDALPHSSAVRPAETANQTGAGPPGRAPGTTQNRPDSRPARQETPMGLRQPPGPNRRMNAQGETPIRPDTRIFTDDLDRQVCTARVTTLPEDFPVQFRWRAATRRMHVVAEIGQQVLLCDDSHDGPHRWPGGDAPPEPRRTAAAAPARQTAVRPPKIDPT